MIDAQQVAEVRKMKEEWVLPPHAAARAALECDDEMREWIYRTEAAGLNLIDKDCAQDCTGDPQFSSLVSKDKKTLEQRFQEQAARWDKETAHLSSPTQRFANPSYQAILGMGNDHREEMIDLLLSDMKENRREWFWALSYLTHENPIERRDAGRLDRMIEAWVRWGKLRKGGAR